METSFTKRVRTEISHHVEKNARVEKTRLTFDKAEIRKDLRIKFIKCGMVYDPKVDYHLEFRLKNINEANTTQKELMLLGVEGKISISDKRKTVIIYIVDYSTIIKALKELGATSTLKEYQKIVNDKRKISDTNRIVNFETANIRKSAYASVRQIKDIKELQKKIDIKNLDMDLRVVVKARMKYTTLSLSELANKIGLSKSILNHRFMKIRKMIGKE